MISVKDLTKEEIFALIDAIPAAYVQPYLKMVPTVFNRLFPGFRIKSITDLQLHNTFKANYRDDYVQNVVINAYLSDIQEHVEKKKNEFIKEGFSENASFVMALVEIIKPGYFQIYLKYFEIQYDQNFLSALNCYANASKRCKELDKEIDDQKDSISKSDALNDKISSLENKNRVLEEEIKSLNSSLEQTRADLDNKQHEISEIKSKTAFAEGAAVPAEKPYSYNGEHPYLSLCQVIKNDDDIWLSRIGDIVNNEIKEFIPDEEKHYFEYRDRLYRKNGPSLPGEFGVWNWTVTENLKDPTKDYVITDFNGECQPISVLIPPNATTYTDLMNQLKEGIVKTTKTRRVMFAVPSFGNSSYDVILCDDSEFTEINGVIKLKENIIRVKKYIIDSNDIIKLGREEDLFYKYIAMPIGGVYVSVDTALEIVKKIVIDKATWNVAKKNGIERRDWQSFIKMVKAIPTDDIYSEIMEKCLCSKEEAKRLLTELEGNAEHLLNGDDISIETLTSIVNNNTELIERCEALVEDKWRAENQELIKEGQARIADLEKECDTKQKGIEELESKLNTIQTEIEKSQGRIREKEKLAADVEMKINQRIEDARKNAADFIAEMSFVSPIQVNNGIPSNNAVKVITKSELPDDIEEIQYGSTETLLEEVLFDNMRDAGIERDSARMLSAYLCSAHIQKIPIFLAGPNSEEIINAYSAACGCFSSVLDCSTPFSSDALQQVYNNDSEIICAKNILNSQWITHIPELLRSKSHIVFVCTFAEDLIIEPKGLYNYAVPIVTDFFVSEKAQSIAYFGKESKDYNPIDLSDEKYERHYNSVKNKIRKHTQAGALFVNNLSNLIKGVYAICGENEAGIAESLCGYVPYLYVCQEVEKLSELLDSDENIPSEKRKEIKNFIGAENE